MIYPINEAFVLYGVRIFTGGVGKLTVYKAQKGCSVQGFLQVLKRSFLV